MLSNGLMNVYQLFQQPDKQLFEFPVLHGWMLWSWPSPTRALWPRPCCWDGEMPRGTPEPQRGRGTPGPGSNSSGWDLRRCAHTSGSFPALGQLLWPAQRRVPGHTDPLGEPSAGTGSGDARCSRCQSRPPGHFHLPIIRTVV